MKQFQSNIPSCRYIFKSGKVAHFNCGIYNTSNAQEIMELDEELAAGHPHIVSGKAVSADDLDPMSTLKKKVIADFLAAQAASVDKDMGAASGITTTKTLVAVTAPSTKK